MEGPEYSFPKPWQEAEDAKETELQTLREENEKLKTQQEALLNLNVSMDRRLQEEHDKRMVDDLTGLANREAFVKKFESMTAVRPGAEQRRIRPATLLMLDLDGFKEVNDAYGHDIGDLTLKETAAFLKSLCREGDFAVRLHGDEFAVVFFDVRPEALLKRFQEQSGVAREALPPDEASLPFAIEMPDLKDPAATTPLAVTMSAGLTEILPGATLTEVLKRGDDALYEAKRGGKNQIRISKTNVAPED